MRSVNPCITTFSWAVKCDKSLLLDKPDIMFDVPFNPVTPIPALEHEGYVGERFLDFDKIALLLKTTEKDFLIPMLQFSFSQYFSAGASDLMR